MGALALGASSRMSVPAIFMGGLSRIIGAPGVAAWAAGSRFAMTVLPWILTSKIRWPGLSAGAGAKVRRMRYWAGFGLGVFDASVRGISSRVRPVQPDDVSQGLAWAAGLAVRNSREKKPSTSPLPSSLPSVCLTGSFRPYWP